jgi:diguanylate cyclase (GGDEF)-like protein/PAS domain S-box-containing protein
MFGKIRQSFSPPVFKDEDQARVARILNTISLAILVIVLVVGLITPFVFERPIEGFITSAATALPVLIVLLLIRRGYVQFARWFFVVTIWVLDTILILLTDGLFSGVAPGYVAVVVLAGLLLGGRAAIGFTVLMALSGLGMLYAENLGVLPPPVIILDVPARWLSLTVNITLAAALLYLATSGINRALERARRGESALAAANKELKKEIFERERTGDELRQLKEFNEKIVQSIAEAIVLEDKEGLLTFANPRTEKLLGYKLEEIMGEHWTVIVPVGERRKVREETSRRPEGFEGQYETLLQKKDGTIIPVLASALPLFRDDLFDGVLTAFIDITELKDTENRLRDSEEKYRTLVENLNVGVFRTSVDEQGHFIHANTAIVEMFGYDSIDEFLGTSVVDLYRKAGDRQRFLDEMKDRGYVKNRELNLIKKDGSPFWAACTATAEFDEQGKMKWIDGVIEDITIRRQTEVQLLYDALHDALTDLPNRTLFFDRLEHTMARAARRDDFIYAVLFLDLDRFKVVNDSLGHSVGDLLLISVAKRLSACLRTVDTIARLGGDEFVILLDDPSGIGEAIAIAERIREELKQPFIINGHEVYTSASIGIVLHSPEYQYPEGVLRDADTAMYRAKKMGKDRYELFDPKMRQDVIARMRIETDLRKAIERDEFRLHYQPLISTESGQVLGFEALLRWEHPERGLLRPRDFLAIAEETGLLLSIGEWVFREACQLIRDIQLQYPQDPPLFVSVNVSKRQFTDPDLIPDIQKALTESGLEPDSLVLEITESVLMEDIDSAASIIKGILDLGVKIQMDDFGTGYSSLATLHRFPIGALKIAREFIVEFDSGEERSEVVHTIITLARNMKLFVIAEGVENLEQLEFLKSEKCDIWQGYYCAKPMTSDNLHVFLMSRDEGELPEGDES